MFKKQALIAIAVIFVLMAAIPVNVWSQAVGPQQNFQIRKDADQYPVRKLVNRIAQLNRISNPNLIHIGDTIYIPSDSITKMYIVEPWIVNGQLAPKGCLWKIAETYLQGNLKTGFVVTGPAQVVSIIQPATNQPSAPTKSEVVDIPTWFKWVFFIGLALILAFLFSILERMDEQKKVERERLFTKQDPDTGTPMIAGGLSENPQVAIAQIESAGDRLFYNHDRVIKEVIRGRICGPPESQFFTTSVWYREGLREVRIPSGTRCYRVTVGSMSDPDSEHTEFWMQHCGNLLAEVASGRFELPLNWKFTPDVEDGEVVQATQSQPNEVATTSTLDKSKVDERAAAGPKDGSHSIELTTELVGTVLTIKGTAKWPRSIEVKNGEYKITF